MQRLILKSFQSPGDIVMLTAAVRDLHLAHPNCFETDVRTSAPEIWRHNPRITPLEERDPAVRHIDMHYPLIHASNQRPYHFLHGYPQYLESILQVSIPVTSFQGELYLSAEERERPVRMGNIRLPERYWILMAGGKYDFTAKWWNPKSYQRVVDHFRGRLEFLQCGEASHWHPPLKNVTSLVGRTSLREFIWLMHHAEGVVCPVTLAMHLAAAVETSPFGRFPKRPCVVIAGAREPPHWEAYPHHQFLSTVGTLSCCATGGCWKSRCQPVGDGDSKDRTNRCEQPVEVSEGLTIPRCLEMIRPEDVIRRIEWYLDGDCTQARPSRSPSRSTQARAMQPRSSPGKSQRRTAAKSRMVLQVSGTLQELVPVGIVVQHLQHYYPRIPLSLDCGIHTPEWRSLLGIALEDSPESPGNRIVLNGVAEPCRSPACPDTLATRWLTHELRLSPIPDLLQYEFALAPDLSGEALFTEAMPQRESANSFVLLLQDSGQRSSDPDFAVITEVLHARGNAVGVLTLSEAVDTVAQLRWISGNESASRELKSVTGVLATLQAAAFVVTADSVLGELAGAVGTPVLCLGNKSAVQSWLVPSRWAFPLARSGDSANDAGGLSGGARFREELEQLLPQLEARKNVAPRPQETARALMPASNIPSESKPVPAASSACFPEASPAGAVNGEKRSIRSRVNVEFIHGLGDVAHFARLIPLYTSRGYEIGVRCTPDKNILIQAAGGKLVQEVDHVHPWNYPPVEVSDSHDGESRGSKVGWNISQSPLPNLGPKGALWQEYCQSRVRVTDWISAADRAAVRQELERLPRPVILLHTKGNTGQSSKSLPDSLCLPFYRELLDRFEGAIVLLDWDNRVPRLDHFRLRHLSEWQEPCSTPRMFALMEASDLLIGVDSGPLHAAGLTDLPRVGIWMPGHYPARYALPDPRQLNLVLEEPTERWNRFRRVPWNIVSQPGNKWDPEWLAEHCLRMLQPAKYLQSDRLGADVQLQHWIDEKCRGPVGSGQYADRNHSFRKLLEEVSRRFDHPTVVETGTIRQEEDWPGAGFSTYLLGCYVWQRGGVLHSVDLSAPHCDFARKWTQQFAPAVTIHQADSVKFLQQFAQQIDVLYLDSLDTTEARHAEHALDEVQVAHDQLHDQSLILIDDTPWRRGRFTGKGALAVPWLLQSGWRILYAGYQVLLEKEPT